MLSNIQKLGRDCLKALNLFHSNIDETTNTEVAKSFLKTLYEYCRHCHINEKKTISETFEVELKDKIPSLFDHFNHKNLLWNLVASLDEKDIFDYCRYRSAIQFLFDDFGDCIPDSKSKLASAESAFEPREYFLSYIYDDSFPDPYPEGPVPEHNGVPNTHWWWKKVEEIYE